MFLTMFFKTQNIGQTMHLTMLIAHPYLGVRGGAALFFGWKSVFTKHPNTDVFIVIVNFSERLWFDQSVCEIIGASVNISERLRPKVRSL